jgi:CMP-N-acetylneuraminic acid synthetase
MTYRSQRILAVIPARGGSKGIPRKNLQPIAGVSLVAHAIRVAHDLDWVDRICLSTDDEEIAAEGRRCGLAVPFLRPPELASDTTGSIEMWQNVWRTSEAHFGERYDVSVLLEPTSPLRLPEDVTATVEAMLSGGYAAAATVSRAPAHFTPHKCLTVDEAGAIGFYHSQGHQYSLRQRIPDFYFRNGICYAVRRNTLLVGGTIIEKECRAVVIDRPVVNIDDLVDLEYAEFLMQKRAKGGDQGSEFRVQGSGNP